MAIRAPDGAKNGHILPTGQWYAPSAVYSVILCYTLLYSVILCLRRVNMCLLGTLAFADNTATSVKFIVVVAMSKTCA